MTKLCIRKEGQCSINIPKEIVGALDWKNGDEVLVSKVPGKYHIIVENLSGVKRMSQDKLKEEDIENHRKIGLK